MRISGVVLRISVVSAVLPSLVGGGGAGLRCVCVCARAFVCMHVFVCVCVQTVSSAGTLLYSKLNSLTLTPPNLNAVSLSDGYCILI